MDLSNLFGSDLLSSGSVATLAKASGADKKQVSSLLQTALPVLVQGMSNNTSTKKGAEALSGALDDHAGADLSDIAGLLKNADTKDGAKILKHILGDDSDSIEKGLAKKSGMTKSQVSGVLSTVAPVLLALLGSKKTETNTSSGGLSSLLGSLLGSSSTDGEASSSSLSSIASLLMSDNDGDGKSDALGLLGKIFGE